MQEIPITNYEQLLFQLRENTAAFFCIYFITQPQKVASFVKKK